MCELRLLMENYWINRAENKELYNRIKRKIPEYRRFAVDQLGWRLIVNERIIKLEKVPAYAERFMGIEAFTEKRDYCVLCALLMFLEDKEDNEQFLLSELVSVIEVRLREYMEVDWTKFVQRKSLVRALQFAEKKGMMLVYDGKSDDVSYSIEREVLYENTGLSRYFAASFNYNIKDIGSYKDFEKEYLDLDTVERDRGHYRINRVYRQLVSSPAMYWKKSDDQDSIYLKSQRQHVQKHLNDYLGGELHIHKNAAFFVMNGDNCFGNTHPKNSMLSELVLILCSEICKNVREGKLVKEYDECVRMSLDQFKNLVSMCKEKYCDGWSKEYREMNINKVVEEVIMYMQNWMMLSSENFTSKSQENPGLINELSPGESGVKSNREFIDTKVTRSRVILAQKGITCAPLYELLEFGEHVSDEEQSLLEEQLSDAGLLDALIVSDEDYSKAKEELKDLSDSLILANPKIHTGYKKLVPAGLYPKLREAAAAVIDNIYGGSEGFIKEGETRDESASYAGNGEESVIVLSLDGYYKNGAIEGHSIPEGEASFVGAIARRNKLARMIAEKEAECSVYREQLDELTGIIDSIQASIDLLDSEYKSIPDFTDLDCAIDMVREADYNLQKAIEECERKENELSKAFGVKKKCEQQVIINCRNLPYERTHDAYTEARDSLESYKSDLIKLERTVNYLVTAKSNVQNVTDSIDEKEEAIDLADLQLKKIKLSIRSCAAEEAKLEEFLNSDENRNRAEKLKRVKDRLNKIGETIKENEKLAARLEEKINYENNYAASLREEITTGIEKENKVRAYFEEELSLKLVNELSPAQRGAEENRKFIEQGGKALYECANEALKCIRENDKSKSVTDVVSSLHKIYLQHNSSLTNYGTSLEDCFEDDREDPNIIRKRQRIVSMWQGKKLYLQEFYDILKDAIDSTRLMIQEKDRALFEDIMANTISTKLNNRILESRSWIKEMSKLMQTVIHCCTVSAFIMNLESIWRTKLL